MAATESNRRNASLKIPALPFRGFAQKYPICLYIFLNHLHPKVEKHYQLPLLIIYGKDLFSKYTCGI
jgi:hypothetical protein